MTDSPSFGWRMPVDVTFGPGCARRIPDCLGDDPVVLLVFEQARALGVQDMVRGWLGERLREVIECPDSLGTLSWARALSGRVWPVLASSSRTVLLAVGGGTVLDMAKLLRCRPLDGDFETLVRALRGQAPWPAMRAERLWLVPTTAGTGSEVTRWATVWDTEQSVACKRSLDEPFGYAERAFVDPDLVASCPPQVTRDCALDALSHALEAMWNRHANPMSDALALSAARSIVAHLPRVMRRPDDAVARRALSLAALQAGFAFSQTRTALAHALSYPLTLEQGVPHGLACAVWLPTAWRLAVGRDERLDALLTRVFELPAAQGGDALARWLQSLGVPLDLDALGVSDAQARIDRALASERGRNFVAAVAG